MKTMGFQGGGHMPLVICEWEIATRVEVEDGAKTTISSFECGAELHVREVCCAVPKGWVAKHWHGNQMRYDVSFVFPPAALAASGESVESADLSRFVAKLAGVNTAWQVNVALNYFKSMWPLTEEREEVRWTRGQWHELDSGWRFEVQDSGVKKQRTLWLAPPTKGLFAPVFPKIGRRPKALEMVIAGPLTDKEVGRLLSYIAVL